MVEQSLRPRFVEQAKQNRIGAADVDEWCSLAEQTGDQWRLLCVQGITVYCIPSEFPACYDVGRPKGAYGAWDLLLSDQWYTADLEAPTTSETVAMPSNSKTSKK